MEPHTVRAVSPMQAPMEYSADFTSLSLKPAVAARMQAAGYNEMADIQFTSSEKLRRSLNATHFFGASNSTSNISISSSTYALSSKCCGNLLEAARSKTCDITNSKEASSHASDGEEAITLNQKRPREGGVEDGVKNEPGSLKASDDGGGSGMSSTTATSINPASNIFTAREILKAVDKDKSIITFCKHLDQVLGGGVPIGQITEVYGQPGLGKTQLCMQLCVNVQIPETFGGCAGEALYIDTEGNLTPERLSDMATYMASHLKQVFELKNKDPSKEYPNPLTRDSILSGINVLRVHDQGELIASVMQIGNIITQNPKIKLVVIDSIAFPFRADYQNNGIARNRTLSQVATYLYTVSHEHRVCVLATNHTVIKYQNQQEGSTSLSTQRLVPALGDLWSHIVTNRIFLHYDSSSSSSSSFDRRASNSGADIDNFDDAVNSTSSRGKVRVATLVKSPSLPKASAAFQILMQGVKDFDSIKSS